jgi:hypothetical protein
MKVPATLVLLLCALLITPVAAQTEQKPKAALGTAGSCEEAKALLDLLRNDVDGEGVIILVARLGDGERSRQINGPRLDAVWSYLHHAGQFPAERLVKAEGEKVGGSGRIDIYAKGRLTLTLTAKRGGDIVGTKSCGAH